MKATELNQTQLTALLILEMLDNEKTRTSGLCKAALSPSYVMERDFVYMTEKMRCSLGYMVRYFSVHHPISIKVTVVTYEGKPQSDTDYHVEVFDISGNSIISTLIDGTVTVRLAAYAGLMSYQRKML